jgi:AcrR family transcriptional regulator
MSRSPSASAPKIPYPDRVPDNPPKPPIQGAVSTAVEALLSHRPLSEVSTSQIIAASGVARSTFYKYYTSKYDVIGWMLQDLRDKLIGLMHPWFDRGAGDPEDSVYAMLSGAAEIWSTHRPTLRAAAENWHSDPELGKQWLAVVNRWIDEIATHIDTERARGWAPPGAPSRKLSEMLVWGCERLLYVGGWDICGPNGEMDAVPGMVAVWIGAVYHSRSDNVDTR